MDDSLQDKNSQTRDVHVHVGSCDDNTLTLRNGGWVTTTPGADRQGQEQLDSSLGDVVHVQNMTNHLEMWRSHDFWIPEDGKILTNSKGCSRMCPTQFKFDQKIITQYHVTIYNAICKA